MWSTVSSSSAEKAALFSLLDEYFNTSRPSTSTLTTPSRAPAPIPRSLPPPSSSSSYIPPTRSTLPTPIDTSSSNATTQSNSFQTQLASHALQQPALSSLALKKAGVPPAAAGAMAQIGAKHHQVLAPHLANAVQQGYQNANSGAAGPPPRGPRAASGLNTESAKSFGRAITSLKAPMPKHDPSKQPYAEPLAVRQSVRNNVPPPPTHRAVAEAGLGKAKALYAYEGGESDDLAVREGEVVDIVEFVSEDWWKCRSNQGREGIIPVAYLEKL